MARHVLTASSPSANASSRPMVTVARGRCMSAFGCRSERLASSSRIPFSGAIVLAKIVRHHDLTAIALPGATRTQTPESPSWRASSIVFYRSYKAIRIPPYLLQAPAAQLIIMHLPRVGTLSTGSSIVSPEIWGLRSSHLQQHHHHIPPILVAKLPTKMTSQGGLLVWRQR